RSTLFPYTTLFRSLIERPERILISLTSIGLSGLGVPYVLPIGMWALAAGSAITLTQRMVAVHKDAKSQDAKSQDATSKKEGRAGEAAGAGDQRRVRRGLDAGV